MIDAPSVSTALFPDDATRLHHEAMLATALTKARARVAAGRVAPLLDLAVLRAELADFDFNEPQSLEAVTAWVIAQLEHGATQMTHPRYFGLFNPAPSFPAECAERIVSQFNPQLASAITSPAPVEIEAHVIRAVGQRAGYGSNAAGHFTSGGSEANFTALICALVAAEPRYAEDGVAAFAQRPVFYVSADAHLAWYKIALQAGLGRTAMCSVATDGTGRMDAQALMHAIAADRAAGYRPVMVVATAGTTGAGMVDPIGACADIALAHGAWLHVDAAWGGGLIASSRHRHVLAGIERADSLTIDAHKWLATTMACGMFITRDNSVLSQAFEVSTVFMPTNAPRQDPYVTSMQWSRRFLGLRLFMALATAGWDGMARHIEHALAMSDLLAQAMTDAGWTVLNASPMAVLCLLPPPTPDRRAPDRIAPDVRAPDVRAPDVRAPDVRAIVQRVVASGVALVSVTTFEGSDVVRACITNGQTTPADVRMLVDALRICAYQPELIQLSGSN